MEYIAPDIDLKAFTCPHCGVLSRQYQHSLDANGSNSQNGHTGIYDILSTICEHCTEYCLWTKGNLIFPDRGDAPPANPDMPDEIKKLYDEAASISSRSPRGAGALLRLAIQNLASDIGDSNKDLNANIADFVKNGLPKKIQKSLDATRVIGNHAFHPGQIDTDSPEVVSMLFFLVNLITENQIAIPKKVDAIYDFLPDGAKVAINQRDQS